MMSTPKLSVIMTVYNGEVFLRETLDAVIAQTFDDWEMIVVNNGSTDGTQSILDSFSDSRIRVVHPAFHGTFGDGIRLAYSHAVGDYIAVQDGDDVAQPERFENQVTALDENSELGLVSCWYKVIDKNGSFIEKFSPPTTMQGLIDSYQTSNPICHSTYMYRRNVSDEVGGYSVGYNFGPDFSLAIKIIKAGYKIKVLPKYLFKIRVHDQQASVDPELAIMRATDALALFNEAREISGVSDWAIEAGLKNLIKRKVQYAVALIKGGFWMSGIKVFLKEAYSHPLFAIAYSIKHMFLK